MEDRKDCGCRRATPGDAAAIARLSRAAYAKYVPRLGREPKPMAADYDRVIAEDEVWVLELDDAMSGVLVLQPRPDHMLIYSIAVDPEWCGEGWGKRLMALAEERAGAEGKPELRLYTNALMEENICFYGRLGYAETARRPHERYPDSTLIFMSKQLGRD